MTDQPTSPDQIVGRNIKRRRLELRLSTRELSGMLGITEQQLQGIEAGTERASGILLYHAADLLEMQLSELFDGVRK